MRTIWKYQLYITPKEQTFLIPGFRGVAHVADQDGFANMITVWCHVDSGEPEKLVSFMVTGTGKPSPENLEFIFRGTALCGDYVWHIWAAA